MREALGLGGRTTWFAKAGVLDVNGFLRAPGVVDNLLEVGGPNSTLDRDDFPVVRDIGANGSRVRHEDDLILPGSHNSNDVVSSQGAHLTQSVATNPGRDVDEGIPQEDLVFNVDGVTTRRVEPRNTPTMTNAGFNFANFWDGRANFVFNGVSPLETRTWARKSWGALVRAWKP